MPKLNRTREQWDTRRSELGRYHAVDAWVLTEIFEDLEFLFQQNFELRDAVESYKIATASLQNQIKDKDQAWLYSEGRIDELAVKLADAEVKGWQNAVSADHCDHN